MSLINDKEQFNKFIEILLDLQNDEVYFISLSARSKYLASEEREYYDLGRAEMFSRNIIRKKEDFEYTLEKLESSLQYKKTKNGHPIPEKCLVVYININPSSMLKAYNMLAQKMNKEWIDIAMALQNKKQPNYSGILYLDRKLMNCVQKSRSRKNFIDIDFDIKNNFYIVNSFMTELSIRQIKYHLIQTKSGYQLFYEHIK